jgi:hypothetical protein
LAAAVALSAALVAVGIVDQVGGRSLAEYSDAAYAPSGTRPAPGLLYGLVYTVGAVGGLLWLPVIRAVRSDRRWAAVPAVVVVAITVALAVLLLVSSEYGARIFPPLWGLLALLSPAAGMVAVGYLRRASRVEQPA